MDEHSILANIDDFGMRHLSIAEASELIARWEWYEEHDYEESISDDELSKRLVAPTARWERRLLTAMQQGEIAGRLQFNRQDEPVLTHTLLNHDSLQAWLEARDYDLVEAFEDWEKDSSELFGDVLSRIAADRFPHTESEAKRLLRIELADLSEEALRARLTQTILDNSRLEGQLGESYRKISEESPKLGTRSKNTLLIVIGALCKKAGIDFEARGAAQRVREATETIGVPVDDETLRTLLNQIPDALERRAR